MLLIPTKNYKNKIINKKCARFIKSFPLLQKFTTKHKRLSEQIGDSYIPDGTAHYGLDSTSNYIQCNSDKIPVCLICRFRVSAKVWPSM